MTSMERNGVSGGQEGRGGREGRRGGGMEKIE